jgi:fructose-bisphosphate aldolase class II
MTLATLRNVLQPALRRGYAVGGLVTLGWEDMRAYTEAAQALGAPLILQAGPSCREHTPLPILGNMFRYLADSVDVPIVAHLDHGYTYEDCKIALESGFTSLMFDGSRKPLQQNIDETAAIAEMAHRAGISCEGEIGFVGYANGDTSTGTDPDEAAQFARQSGVDAMAISCGNVHLQENKEGGLDLDRIKAIEAVTDLPLVIHGGSGVPVAERKLLSLDSRICKFNIGTELRMAFGDALRRSMNADPTRFDRVQILRETGDPVRSAAMRVLTAFGAPDLRT